MMRRGIVKSIRKTSNMLEYVKNNPYRILGVYANDPEKKWVENSLELFACINKRAQEEVLSYVIRGKE